MPVPAGCVMRALDRLTPGAADAAAERGRGRVRGPYQRHSLDAPSVAGRVRH